MFEQWLTASMSTLVMVVVSTVGVYAAVIVFTRLGGLRSFSKMSSFDFAMTVAIGSLVASTVVAKDPPLIQGVVALAAIYGLQKFVGFLRRYTWATKLVDNEPTLLMKDGKVLHDNLKRTDVTKEDLRAKLREANVLELSQVRAAVFETTGDIAVLHSSDEDVELEAWLLEGVEDVDETASRDPLGEDEPAPAE
jgi:uncharacterized membrane protein YcaP (DUF421 family)